MGTLLVHGGTVMTPFDVIEGGAVLARDGVIERVGTGAGMENQADETIDAGGRFILPGFVDLQVNGGGGALLTEQPERDSLAAMARAHAQFGATSMLPTVVTADPSAIARALEVVREAVRDPVPGARVVGAHLEGPFLNPERKGAHDGRQIQKPDPTMFERFARAAAGTLRLITLAPELPGALDVIAAARDAGAAVALGHSDATYAEAKKALEAGAALGTHLFNAMRPVRQREPGVAGALLDDDRARVSLIADGVHVHPALLRLAARIKGASGTVLVTDAMPVVGSAAQSFSLGGRHVTVRDGACFLEDGTLAGSALSMDAAVRTMHHVAGVPLRDCIEMATATPACTVGLGGEIGVLAAGARMDMVICDEELAVWKTVIGGRIAFAAAD